MDVGSNSVLLTIEDQTPDGWRPVYESSAVTALGEGTKTTGVLSEQGMQETLHELRRAFSKAQEMASDSVVAAATMAARIATNSSEFIARAAAQHTPIIVLSGDDEAQLGFESVATDPLFSKSERLSIVDVGGQSTEIQSAKNLSGWDVLFRCSFPVGTLGLRSTIFPHEACEPPEILSATCHIDELVGRPLDGADPGKVVLLGATGTNLVSIRERLDRWEPERVHGAFLLFEEVGRAVGWLMPMTDHERSEIPGIERGREKTLHIGALIAERSLFALGAEGCYVSVRGWRHALIELGLPNER